MNDYRIMPAIALLCLLAMPIQQSVAQEAAGQDAEVATLEEVVVLGSRVPTRSAHDSPVPIDVIEGTSMRNYGVRDINSLLRATVPSYNVNQQPLSDAATLVRPANLRGLPPDSTLILVNGKRRHRGSVITFLGGGLSNGAHATDLASIPAIALKRVEVLRDGAAAQYGSDAVAGVMNFVLKDAPDSGTVEARWGKYYAGDGDTRSIAANLGVPLDLPFIQSGFANISFEYGSSDPTIRADRHDSGGQGIVDARKDAGLAPTVGQQTGNRSRFWGAPEFQYDYKLFGNLGMKLNSKTEVYAFGNYAQRKIEGGFFYRNPNARDGIFTGPQRVKGFTNRGMGDKRDIYYSAGQDGTYHGTYGNYLEENRPTDYADLSDARKKEIDENLMMDVEDEIYDTIKVVNLDPDQGRCPIVEVNDEAEYSDVIADLPSNCFMFNEKFPGGFTPRFGGTVRDWSGAAGIRGDIADWHYDLSAVFGQHSTEFFMKQTINPQLAALRLNIPTDYKPGTYIQRDRVFNLDLSRSLQTAMLPSPLNIGVGLEYRTEEFETLAGGENSWYRDERPGGLADQGFGIGSNGFVGFPTDIAKKNSRNSYAAYVDLETNVTKDILVGAAGRYEDFETFGDTLNGKLNARWQATSVAALRGSISTGFRAPTVGQVNIQSVTTAISDGKLTNELNFPAAPLVGIVDGAKALKPERAFNLSAGAVADFGNLTVTVDYYRIQVRDRIALTDKITLTGDQKNRLRDERGIAQDIEIVKFFTNAFGSTTQGVDVVATYPMALAGGNTLWTFAGNFNKTQITDIINEKTVPDHRVVQLEKAIPTLRFTLTGDHRQGPWQILGRVYWYDGFTEFTADSAPDERLDAGQQWLVDLETSYTMKTGLTVSAGAQNLFDSYPDRTTNGVSGTRYAEFAPYGFNGGYYYLRALYAF
jgi:iron complex outermembrane receptor protein